MNVKKGILILLAACSFTISGCGAGSEKVVFSPGTEKIAVTMERGDDFYLSDAGGTILVKQKGKIMLQGAFLTKEVFEATKEKLHDTNLVTIYSESEDKVIYDQAGAKGLENRCLMRIPDTDTYVLFTSWLPREAADRVLDKLTFTKGD